MVTTVRTKGISFGSAVVLRGAVQRDACGTFLGSPVIACGGGDRVNQRNTLFYL